MTKTIERQNQKISCVLTYSDHAQNPKFILTTKTNGHINSYEVTAKIGGLNDCKENSLFFLPLSVEFIGGSYNEETLIDSAVFDIFEELTQG